ncbi:MAG: insulinase family protein [Fimbriimonadaceae bacterium]
MLIPFVLAAVVAQPITAPLRQVELPSGVVIIAENQPEAEAFSLTLTASSRGAEDTEATYGYRHLLEQLVARGVDGEVDRRLESVGAYLTAQTTREALIFEINGPPEYVALAADVMVGLVGEFEPTAEDIEREAELIEEEIGLLPPALHVVKRAWSEAYGETALDTHGDADVIALATPEEMTALHREHFRAPGIALALVGPFETEVSLSRLTELAESIRPGSVRSQRAWIAERSEVTVGFGQFMGRAVVVAGLQDGPSVHALAAALALGQAVPGLTPIYNPSSEAGLITLSAPRPDAVEELDALSVSELRSLYPIGRSLLRKWLENELSDPTSASRLRSQLVVAKPDMRPDWLLDSLEQMTEADFVRAAERFQTGGEN